MFRMKKRMVQTLTQCCIHPKLP